MGISIREKRGRLYLDVYWKGERHWETLGLTVGPNKTTRSEAYRLAEKIKTKWEYQLVSEQYGFTDLIKAKQTFMEYATEESRKMPVKSAIPKALPYITRYAGKIQISGIDELWLEGFQEFLKKQDTIGPATQARYYAAVVQLLNKAVRDRIIPRNPSERVRGLRTPESVKVHLTSEELTKLSTTSIGGVLGAEVKRAFLFCTMTGLRVSDVRTLVWAEIDGDSQEKQIIKRQVKTGRVVSIPLHSAAWELINDKALHKRQELVFPRLSASKTNTNEYLKSWALKAGIEKVIGWHTARHTFAVLALENGADFYTVSKLMGHSKPMMTATYAKATDTMKRKAVNGLPDISFGELTHG